MNVKWLGHACFLLTSVSGLKVLTDPYEASFQSLLSYDPVRESPDIVTISHDHGDHNYTGVCREAHKSLKDQDSIGLTPSSSRALRATMTGCLGVSAVATPSSASPWTTSKYVTAATWAIPLTTRPRSLWDVSTCFSCLQAGHRPPSNSRRRGPSGRNSGHVLLSRCTFATRSVAFPSMASRTC